MKPYTGDRSLPPTNLKEKFGRRFVVRDDGTDDPCREERVWCMEIPGKLGTIYPCGYNGDFAVWTASKYAMRQLLAIGCQQWQGDVFCSEAAFRFPLSLFDQVAAIVRSRKRRSISQAEHDRLKAIGSKFRFGQSRPVSPA